MATRFPPPPPLFVTLTHLSPFFINWKYFFICQNLCFTIDTAGLGSTVLLKLLWVPIHFFVLSPKSFSTFVVDSFLCCREEEFFISGNIPSKMKLLAKPHHCTSYRDHLYETTLSLSAINQLCGQSHFFSLHFLQHKILA